MTYDEAETIRAMIDGHWNMRMNSATAELWLMGLMTENAEAATVAVAHLANTMTYPPKIADVKEILRMNKLAGGALPKRRALPRKPDAMPFWVKRWCAARFLHERFGKEQDFRYFDEQKEWLTPDELRLGRMPDDAWVEEAERVSDQEVWKFTLGGAA
jgi:hypothetical protein